MRFLVSACLAGLPTRYDGGGKKHPLVVKLVRSGLAIPFCPEQLGGLPTPRTGAEIQRGTGTEVLEGKASVMTETGEDVTGPYCLGAQISLQLAELAEASVAILKARSPSCGTGVIYDGSFQNRGISGHGVTAALLAQKGMIILTEEDLTEVVVTQLLRVYGRKTERNQPI